MDPQDDGQDRDDDRERVWASVLKGRYDEVTREPMPDKFFDLLKQLDDVESGRR